LVSREGQSWIVERFARLTTGVKMLLILSLALFPLGLIAILASIESARQNSAERAEETLTRLEIKAQRLNSALSRSSITISAASAAISLASDDSRACEETLRRLEAGQFPARYALFAGPRLRCATRGYTPPGAIPASKGRRVVMEIAADGEALRFAVYGEDGRLEGLGEYSREMLARLSYIPGTSPAFNLVLSQGEHRMVLRDQYRPTPLVRTVRGTRPIAGDQLALSIALGASPVTAAEILLTLLPVLMWLAAGTVAWFIADRLLSKPLVLMQRAVAAYRPGDRQLNLPNIATPAQEIRELGQAFNQVTQTVARHEADLEAALDRQIRLVREVHHRVKNNLQVVASLLNLHARSARSEDVAAAYASIQRRVDALAVVHRNHYAELEENRGVALKPLVSELASNLRGTAPSTAAHMAISLDLQPLYVTQDVAVSVAFFVTEIVEFAMLCGATSVSISLRRSDNGSARLALGSEALRGEADCDPALFERFERIVIGLSRQLRSVLDRDLEGGSYAIDLAVSPDREGESD
jgi:two-component sensor histidine kinase